MLPIDKYMYPNPLATLPGKDTKGNVPDVNIQFYDRIPGEKRYPSTNTCAPIPWQPCCEKTPKETIHRQTHVPQSFGNPTGKRHQRKRPIDKHMCPNPLATLQGKDSKGNDP
jgi:hypothetical protein